MKNRISLALNICTYKRETILKENLRLLLTSKFFDDKDIEFYGNLDVFVIDNASEITVNDITDSPSIHLFHNRNTGGSGGFQRGIEEIRKFNKEFTHVIFMDDDVKFELSCFYILFDFLRNVDKIHADRPVAGRMFDIDNPYIQWTAAEKWNGGDIQHVEFLRDITKGEPYIPGKVNYDVDAEYGGWWFCCYPYEFVKDNDVLPFFLHCDDVEYGLRCGKKPIIIEGVQVWHETWEKKMSPTIVYYDTRNSLFVNEMYGMLSNTDRLYGEVIKKKEYYRNRQDLLSEYMVLLAAIDFLGGFNRLIRQNSTRNHRRICNFDRSDFHTKELKRAEEKFENRIRTRRSKELIKPKVSIVVPVYNVEKYLYVCIESIRKQTLSDIEIICVDDGSKDKSGSILDDYAKKDNRIRVFHKSNSGYGNTMNVGLDNANGEYIGIVESDDYIESNMYEKLYKAAEKRHAEIVKSDHYTFSSIDGKEKKTYQYVCPIEYYGRILNAEICPEIFQFTMMNWTGIYRTDFIREKRIRHNETPGASFQDNGFWFQVISQAERILFLNEAFYHYRQDNPDSSINSKNKVFCMCDEYKFMSEFLRQHNEMGEEYHKRFLEKKLFNYLNSYYRIAEEYKLDFLGKIAQEFEEDIEDPLLRVETIDPWVWGQINRIIDSPKLFYIEDGIITSKQKYNDTHEKLMRLRNSEEFKRGLKIKKIMGFKI